MSEKEMAPSGAPVPFSVMAGGRSEFVTNGGKKYTIRPMMAAHIDEFKKDKLNVGRAQMITSFDSPESEAKLNKWLGEVTVEFDGEPITAIYCKNEKGETMSLAQTKKEGWDVTDYPRYLLKLCDISG